MHATQNYCHVVLNFHLFFCWNVSKLYFSATVFNKDATCNQFGMSALIFPPLLSFLHSFAIYIYDIFVYFNQKIPPYVQVFLYLSFFYARAPNSTISLENVNQLSNLPEKMSPNTIFTQVFVNCVLNYCHWWNISFSPGLLSLFSFFNMLSNREIDLKRKGKKNNIDAFDWFKFRRKMRSI